MGPPLSGLDGRSALLFQPHRGPGRRTAGGHSEEGGLRGVVRDSPPAPQVGPHCRLCGPLLLVLFQSGLVLEPSIRPAGNRTRDAILLSASAACGGQHAGPPEAGRSSAWPPGGSTGFGPLPPAERLLPPDSPAVQPEGPAHGVATRKPAGGRGLPAGLAQWSHLARLVLRYFGGLNVGPQ